MKKICLIAVFSLACITLKAQTGTVTGTVKSDKGDPLHYVFVLDDQDKTAAFTDSLGNFSIQAKQGAKLQFDLPGYNDAAITADKSDLQVVLAGAGSSSAGATSTSSGQTVTETVSKNELATASNDMGGYLKPAHEKGNTRGNQYLFGTPVHGFLVNASGEIVYNPAYRFDYDKMGGGLLLTKDQRSVVQVNWDQVRYFSLFASNGTRYDFEKAPAIDPSHYVQVLASGGKYKIYKLIKTKFVKSDYVNNGVTSHGNDYDEYVDDADYYVVDVQANQPKKVSLRKKSLKDAFAKDADKANKYMSDNSGDIDDAYLSKLGAYMNQ
jgi:hypothetical protein